jgi:pullulanase-type alpha-1,6-glucosidase
VWQVTGTAYWTFKYYLFEVEVFTPSTQRIEKNLVTDPYSVSLSKNSQRSQIVNLDDCTLKPPGWDELPKPFLTGPNDIVVYELHLRDFSIFDETVPEVYRGTFMAFTQTESNGMRHLRHMAEAGLTHIQLLPVFDFATINEDRAERREPDRELLAQYGPNSEEQQALIALSREYDGYNWGYDPYHPAVPEGSYATDPDGSARILEFRAMVQSLNKIGLRVVMDVAYNHTHASGQNEKSVLDKIVPGYYHRLDLNGKVETSTCCSNTATEHAMMEKLMIDTLLIWARDYKVDGFRFDLMGHHMVANMTKVRDTLHSLTMVNDGVDGSSIYIYGEGWDFGEVVNNARGVNATQLNLGGTGIGTFNDRMRDAVRGDKPFTDQQEQGFITGLYYDPNEVVRLSEAEQLNMLLWYADLIRLGLAGNLSDYVFVNQWGEQVTGASVDYLGYPAGYTENPQEHIVYVSAHDNETLFDSIQYKVPSSTGVSNRVRIQNLGLSLVALAQGIPFFHAGSDMLRSKSLDRNSHNSGDWFNRLDFTYNSNNWGVGLPPAESNADNYSIMRPLLGLTGIRPAREEILKTVRHFREILRLRKSSPLFRLKTAAEVRQRVRFHNVGPDQTPGLIVMSLDDSISQAIDPNFDRLVVLFNACNEVQTFAMPELTGIFLTLHPIQVESHDPIVREANYNRNSGEFAVPARTTAVFVQPVVGSNN